MKVLAHECDVCCQQRAKDANNWFLITQGSPEIIFRPWHGATPEAVDSADFHVCGASCLLKKISELTSYRVQKTLEG